LMENGVKGPEFDILHICRVMVFSATLNIMLAVILLVQETAVSDFIKSCDEVTEKLLYNVISSTSRHEW